MDDVTNQKMTWRTYVRDANGNEDVVFSATQRAAVAGARALLMEGRILIRIESDDGEIIEGKSLQDAVTSCQDPRTTN